MRKSTIFFCSAAALLAIGVAGADLIPVQDFLLKDSAKREIPAGFTRMDFKGQAVTNTNKGNSIWKASQSQTSEVLFEDFNNVPDGEFIQTGSIGMRADTPIASAYYDCTNFINPEYTPNSGQWYGEWVYAGTGGTIVLQTYNPSSSATLQLPLGDYSGDLTVTMRVRYRPSFYGADNEVGYVTTTGTEVLYMPVYGGFDSYNSATTDLPYGYDYVAKLYPNDGWVEAKFSFRNESANADGTIIICTSNACEIDWIKVEDAGTYLAAPAVSGVTDFQENQFTMKWDPVRRAYNYYIDFFYAKWLADSGVDEAYEFEEGIPEGFTAGGATAAPSEGYNSTNCIRLEAGEENAFVTPTFVAPLTESTFKYMCVQTSEDSEVYPTLYVDGLTAEGWRPILQEMVDGWWTSANYYYEGNLSGEQFANQYTALRFYTTDTDDENYFVIDDLTAFAPRPYELDRVKDENHGRQMSYDDYLPYIEAGYYTEEEVKDEILNGTWNFWYNTERKDPCEYTFNESVEADKEYFYRVRSHRMEINGNGNTFAPSPIVHALGVAAPTLGDAQDVNGSSYTATWKDAAKAQNFIVTSYEAEEIAEDTPDYNVFTETFSNLEGSIDVDSYQPVEGELDTDMPGWTGESLVYGQNVLGCDYYGMLTSPELGVVAKGNRPYYVYFEAEGMYGETLIVQFNGLQTYCMAAFEEDGTIAGVITVPVPVEGETISFYTYNGYNFGVKALEVTQDMKQGDLVRKYDARQIVPAGVQKATFTGLDADKKYAYKVVSNFKFEQEYVNSMANGLYKVVDLKDGSTYDFSKVEDLNIEEGLEVVARYTVEGLTVPENYKGIVIEKLSNGTTRKVIVR